MKYNLGLLTIITIFSIFLVTLLFDVNLSFKSKTGSMPPPLSDIGPHRKFIDEKTCLGCHQTGLKIPGVGNSPKIPHEFRKDCISCHVLPGLGVL